MVILDAQKSAGAKVFIEAMMFSTELFIATTPDGIMTTHVTQLHQIINYWWSCLYNILLVIISSVLQKLSHSFVVFYFLGP